MREFKGELDQDSISSMGEGLASLIITYSMTNDVWSLICEVNQLLSWVRAMLLKTCADDEEHCRQIRDRYITLRSRWSNAVLQYNQYKDWKMSLTLTMPIYDDIMEDIVKYELIPRKAGLLDMKSALGFLDPSSSDIKSLWSKKDD